MTVTIVPWEGKFVDIMGNAIIMISVWACVANVNLLVTIVHDIRGAPMSKKGCLQNMLSTFLSEQANPMHDNEMLPLVPLSMETMVTLLT